MLPFNADFFSSHLPKRNNVNKNIFDQRHVNRNPAKDKADHFDLESMLDISKNAKAKAEEFRNSFKLPIEGKPAELHGRLSIIHDSISGESVKNFSNADWQSIEQELESIGAELESLSESSQNPAFDSSLETMGIALSHLDGILLNPDEVIHVEESEEVNQDHLFDELTAAHRSLSAPSEATALGEEKNQPVSPQGVLEQAKGELEAVAADMSAALDSLGPLQTWQVSQARNAVTGSIDAIAADLVSDGDLSVALKDRLIQLEAVREEVVDRLGFTTDEIREDLSSAIARLHDAIHRAGGSYDRSSQERQQLWQLSNTVNFAIEKLSERLLHGDTKLFERLILGPGLGQLAQVKEAIIEDLYMENFDSLDSHILAVGEVRDFIQGLADWSALQDDTEHAVEDGVVSVLSAGIQQASQSSDAASSALGSVLEQVEATKAKLDGLSRGDNSALAVEVFDDLQSISNNIDDVDESDDNFSQIASIGEEIKDLIATMQNSYRTITQPESRVVEHHLSEDHSEHIDAIKNSLVAAMTMIEHSIRYETPGGPEGIVREINADSVIEDMDWGREFLKNFNAADAVVSHLVSEDHPDKLVEVVNNDRLFEGIRKLKEIASDNAKEAQEAGTAQCDACEHRFSLEKPQTDSGYLAFTKEVLEQLDVREVADIGMEDYQVRNSDDLRLRSAEIEKMNQLRPKDTANEE